MSKYIKSSLSFLSVIGLVLLLSTVAYSTITSGSMTKTSANGFTIYTSSTYTLGANATDTVNVTLPVVTARAAGTAIGKVFVGVTSLNGDSVRVAADYGYSYDGTVFTYIQLGIDSTATATGTSYDLTQHFLITTTHPDAPYKRVRLRGTAAAAGGTANNAGTKARVTFMPEVQ